MAKTNREKKKKARQKRLVKERNVKANQAAIQYYLMVDFPEDGSWKRMMSFRDKAQVEAYLAETEKIRDDKDTRIFEGVIYSKFGNEVKRIKKYDPPELDTVNPASVADTPNTLDLEAASGD